jgi:OMF family outer membrane factor
MNRSAVLLLLLVLFLSAHGAQVDGLGSIPLDLDGALQAAFQNSLEIKTAKNGLLKAEAQIDESKGRFLPSLDFSANARRIKNFDEFTGVNVEAEFQGETVPVEITPVTPKYSADASVEATWNIYSGGGDTANLNASRSGYEIAFANLSLIEQEIFSEVVRIYIDVRKSILEFDQAEKVLELAKRRRDIDKLRYESGEISDITWQENELAVKESEFEFLQKQNALDTSVDQYIDVIGMGENALVPSIEELKMLVRLESISLIYEMIDKYLGDRRSDLDVKVSELNLSRERKKELISEYRPKVDIISKFTGKGRSSTESDSDVFSDFDKSESMLGIQMTWNLFEGYQTTARVSQARSDISVAGLEVEKARLERDKKVREIQARIVEMREQVELYRAKLELSVAKEAISEKKLVLNLISEVEHEEVMISVIESRIALEKASMDLLEAMTEEKLAM